jgi:hypothetical protein
MHAAGHLQRRIGVINQALADHFEGRLREYPRTGTCGNRNGWQTCPTNAAHGSMWS